MRSLAAYAVVHFDQLAIVFDLEEWIESNYLSRYAETAVACHKEWQATFEHLSANLLVLPASQRLHPLIAVGGVMASSGST